MTHRFFRFHLIIVLLFFSSCTHLSTRHREDYWYKSPARCAQGPFELRIPARGAPWGEQMTLQVYSPRKLGLRVEHRLDNEEHFHKGWAGEEATMENKECLSQEGTPGAPQAGPGDGSGDGVTGQPGTPQPEAPEKGPTPGTVQENPTLVRENPDNGKRQDRPTSPNIYTITLLDRQKRGIDGPPPVPGERFVIVRIWSTLPNDLEHVRFVVEHRAYVPMPNEKEYVAKLRKEERQRQRKAEKRQREARRREEKRQQDWLKRQERLARERELAAKNPARPVKTARPSKPAKPPKVRKYQYQACVTGRHRGSRVQICRKFDDYAEYQRCILDPKDLPCWHRKRKGRWHYGIAETPGPSAGDPQPRPRPADGPPPAPQVEVQPPRASENATWVPGYWRWNGFRWLWLAGFWRVPQSDLEQEKTAVAPDEPPPVKVEAPVPPPFSDAVWTPGYWHWVAGAWLWVPGRWLVPPAAGNQWSRPQWRRTPRGVILVPGRWIRR